MIRWDNVLLLVLLLLIAHAVREFVLVCSTHGPNLIHLYERIFRPELQPVFWLEVFLLLAVLVYRWRSALRCSYQQEDKDQEEK